MFQEPAPTRYDLHFSLLGIPVRVHPLFWAVCVFFSLGSDLSGVLSWTAAAFVSILFHELGHAYVARACGWPPWIVLHGFGGLACYRPTYHNWRRQVLISLAGPGAGFLLAAFLYTGLNATGHRVELKFGAPLGVQWQMSPFANPGIAHFVDNLFFINIWWGLINLLPIYPLDGGQISRELFVQGSVSPQDGIVHSLQLSVVCAVGVAIYGFVRLHNEFLAIFFAYMAFTSFQMLQAYMGHIRY